MNDRREKALKKHERDRVPAGAAPVRNPATDKDVKPGQWAPAHHPPTLLPAPSVTPEPPVDVSTCAEIALALRSDPSRVGSSRAPITVVPDNSPAREGRRPLTGWADAEEAQLAADLTKALVLGPLLHKTATGNPDLDGTSYACAWDFGALTTNLPEHLVFLVGTPRSNNYRGVNRHLREGLITALAFAQGDAEGTDQICRLLARIPDRTLEENEGEDQAQTWATAVQRVERAMDLRAQFVSDPANFRPSYMYDPTGMLRKVKSLQWIDPPGYLVATCERVPVSFEMQPKVGTGDPFFPVTELNLAPEPVPA